MPIKNSCDSSSKQGKNKHWEKQASIVKFCEVLFTALADKLPTLAIWKLLLKINFANFGPTQHTAFNTVHEDITS